MYTELEDVIINCLIQLNNYKAMRRINGKTLERCINTIKEELSKNNITFTLLDHRECIKNTRYFDVIHNQISDDIEYIMKDNITISDLTMYIGYSSSGYLSYLKTNEFYKV